MRFFNTEGPIRPDRHYCLPPLHRWNLNEILELIDQEKYFLLHAPRQTGKTSCLLALMDHLNHEGRYRAVYANLEGAQAYREQVDQGMATVVTDIAAWAQEWSGEDEAPELARQVLATMPPGSALGGFLSQWCASTPQPLVLMLDEVDALVGDTLISLLRQLRAGYLKRPQHFPQTVILCGVRDLRDYRIGAERRAALQAILEALVGPHVDDEVQVADLGRVIADHVAEMAELDIHPFGLVRLEPLGRAGDLERVDPFFDDHFSSPSVISGRRRSPPRGSW